MALLNRLTTSVQSLNKKLFSVSQWQRYTQDLVAMILENQPDSEKLIRQINIKVYSQDVVYAWSDAEHKLIGIFYGQIKLIQSEDEYVFILAHEIAHIKRHDKEIYILFGWTSYHDIELRRQNELDADEDAYDVIRVKGYDPCAPFMLENRMMVLYKTANHNIDRQSTQGIFVDIFQSRLDVMEKHCHGD